MSALDEFLTVACDLYLSDASYRAEIEAERDGKVAVAEVRWSMSDQLTELEWLIRNGVEPGRAVEQFGWSLESAQSAARRWFHPVHAFLLPEVETGASATWARQWLGASRVDHAAA